MKKVCFLIDNREYYKPFINKIKKFNNIVIISFLTRDNIFFYNYFKNYKKYTNLDDVIKNNDIIFSLGYWKIIPKKLINIKKIINIHYSYLLKYEGRHTCTYAIQNNEKYHGVTFHYITEKLDNGPIILSEKVYIDKNDTSYTLMKKCSEKALEMFSNNFEKIINNNIKIILKKDPNHICNSYKNIKHEISTSFINNKDKLYNIIRSLTYKNKKKPYIILYEKKIYFYLETN